MKLKFCLLLCLAQILIPYAEARELTSVSLQLLWKHQFQFAGYYIAREKGYYADEGLDVTIHEFSPDTDLVGDVLSGKRQFAVGRSSILIDKARDRDIVALFAAFQNSPLMLLSLESAGIREPRDLKGRNVMLTHHAEQVADVLAMMLQSGVASQDFTLQPHSFRLQDLIDGKTDAMGSYVSNEPYQLQLRGIPYRILHPKDYGFKMYSDILFTSGDMVYQQPEVTEGFYRASMKGWLYALNNIEESVDIILAGYNSQKRSRRALLFEAGALRPLAFDEQNRFGTISRDRLTAMAQIYLLTGTIREEFSHDGFVFTEVSYIDSGLSQQEQLYLRSLPSLRLCVDPDWMPYEGLTGANHRGMISDYIRLINETLKLDMTPVPSSSWSETTEQIHLGNCDLVSGAMQTPSRAMYLQFSRPYMSMPAVIALSAESPIITSPVSLYGKKIAVVQDYAFEEILRYRHPEIQLVTVSSMLEGLRLVENGEVFGLINAEAAISQVIRDNHITGIRLSRAINDNFDISVAVPQRHTPLIEILNRVIADISPEQHSEILNRWISIRYQRQVDYSLVWKILAAVAVVLLFFSYRYMVIRSHNRQLKVLANHDNLTGIYNRHMLYSRLEDLAAVANRYGRPLSVIYFDIDDFKLINDTLGHQAGDDTLRSLTRTVSESIRDSDIFGRWGGEEFLIIVPESSLTEARESAEKLRALIDERFRDSDPPLTCSFGVSEHIAGETVDSLVSRADRALYHSKSSGKNRVSVTPRSNRSTGGCCNV